MNRNDLYKVAFRYKKTKLWKKLWDNDVFAVRLTNGKIAYLSVMGNGGDYCALGVYIGEDGFRSYHIIANADKDIADELKYREVLLKQKCLQVAFEEKDCIFPEELAEVRKYAKANGIRVAGKNAYPTFIKFEPNYHPWKVKEQPDIDMLYEATEAAALLAELLATVSPVEMGIINIGPYTEKVPLFKVDKKTLKQDGFVPLPKMREESYDTVVAKNDIAIAGVKKLPHKGIWEAQLVRMPTPAQEAPNEAPYYPLLFLIVENKKYYVLPVPMVMRYEENPAHLLDEFAGALKSYGAAPKVIHCRDERTYAFLNDFAQKTEMRIKIYNGVMFALDDVKANLLEQFDVSHTREDKDKMDEIIDMILSMPRSEMKKMPHQLIEIIKMMIDDGVFPKEVASALTKKLKGY